MRGKAAGGANNDSGHLDTLDTSPSSVHSRARDSRNAEKGSKGSKGPLAADLTPGPKVETDPYDGSVRWLQDLRDRGLITIPRN